MSNDPIVIRRPSQKELHEAFRPYAVELGYLIYAWNRLHERLAALFFAVGTFENREVAHAIWHSTPSDLAQRKMLRAAAETGLKKDCRAQKEIIWLLDQIDKSLSDKRNNALHTPFMMMVSNLGITLDVDWTSLAPRTSKLRGKDLIKEFAWYQEYTDALSAYVQEIRVFLPRAPEAWPERPLLPHLGQKTSHTESTQKKKNK
jgi:hypothetical protein